MVAATSPRSRSEAENWQGDSGVRKGARKGERQSTSDRTHRIKMASVARAVGGRREKRRLKRSRAELEEAS